MYIEKLSDEEIKQLFKQLVSIVEKGNLDRVNSLLDNAKVRRGMGAVGIVFDTGYEMQHCTISDYNAFVSYGHVTDEDKIRVEYRKSMYKKFGNNYYNDMRDYYKSKIIKRYDKELEELSNELNEVIK